MCLDFNVKNPTCASITYGILLSMDCSAVHRSLSMHISFVRQVFADFVSMVNQFVIFLCEKILCNLSKYDCVANSIIGNVVWCDVVSECFMWVNLEHCIVLLHCVIPYLDLQNSKSPMRIFPFVERSFEPL